MKLGVPIRTPFSVKPSSPSSRQARPKSVTFGVPSAVSRTFAGLRSRWTIPLWCAMWTAPASVAVREAAQAAGCGVPATFARRLPPSTSSMVK
jgi:hypothetical protein